MTAAIIIFAIACVGVGSLIAYIATERADSWRRELARERERRIKAERDSTERMGLLLELQVELQQARSDLANMLTIDAFRQGEKQRWLS